MAFRPLSASTAPHFAHADHSLVPSPAMPSHPLPPPPPALAGARHSSGLSKQRLLLLLAAAAAVAAAAVAAAVLFALLRRRRRRLPTLPFSPPPPPARPLRRYSRRALRRATGGFHASRLLGRGAASPVYLASFPDASLAAVKTSSSPHELHLLASLPLSPHLVSLLGYSSSTSSHPLLLVFEYMPRGSLQAALFGNSSAASCGGEPGFLDWGKRYAVIADVARALAFLHFECQRPVVHGDLKPSNVLLDAEFRAKLADFGLARFKNPEAEPDGGFRDEFLSQELGNVDFSAAIRSSGCCKNSAATATNAAVGLYRHKEPPGAASGNGGEEADEALSSPRAAGAWGKEWWWKQDGSGELDAKDYVAEWIGSQICPERNPDWDDDGGDDDRKSSPEAAENIALSSELSDGQTPEKRSKKKRACNGNGNGNAADKKDGKIREWWKEEYFEEMSKKAASCAKKRSEGGGKRWFRSISTSNGNGGGGGGNADLDISFRKGWKKGRARSRSAGSDMFSGDLLSRELSSTTSMRGTVCYVAPECGGGGGEHHHLAEKSDVYSFGVLVLVVLSGRRPLHVLSSPMRLERANLVSWCRQLARAGTVLELVDERLEGRFDREQAALCANLALLCLQRLPELRPDSADIVRILAGEMELPAAPAEFSPSPRARPFPRSVRPAAPTEAPGATGAYMQ